MDTRCGLKHEMAWDKGSVAKLDKSSVYGDSSGKRGSYLDIPGSPRNRVTFLELTYFITSNIVWGDAGHLSCRRFSNTPEHENAEQEHLHNGFRSDCKKIEQIRAPN